jgi:hypothetical protein
VSECVDTTSLGLSPVPCEDLKKINTTIDYVLSTRGIDVGESTWHRVSVTNEPYVVYSFVYDDIDDATYDILSWLKSYIVYATNIKHEGQLAERRIPTIYWRVKPEISKDEDTGQKRVYMRLLLSNKDVPEVIYKNGARYKITKQGVERDE